VKAEKVDLMKAEKIKLAGAALLLAGSLSGYLSTSGTWQYPGMHAQFSDAS